MHRVRERATSGPVLRVAALTITLLLAGAVAPASAHAVDLFPVDDWLGSGIKKAGEVVLGPLKLGAEEIARLIATIVGALADLLIPKSLVRAGVDGIRWLVQLPPVGADVRSSGEVVGVRMPHLAELRGVLTWIAVTLLPLGVIVQAGSAFLLPTADTESPAEVLQRASVAGFALLSYDWAWGVVTRLTQLLTDALLGLPWVADGVERMLETLVIGGAAGTAVAAEFVVPLLVMAAGGALLALLLLRVGLEVATALVYVLGGLALAGSVTTIGRRLFGAWLLATTAVVVLPVLWAVVFVTGAALMLDAEPSGGAGFAGFVAQLYNVAAALAVFVVAIKLSLGVFRQASGAMSTIASAPAAGRGGGAGVPVDRARALAAQATPAGLARFSHSVRGGARTASFPLRHPVTSARAAGAAARSPVQATRASADALCGVLRRTPAGSTTSSGAAASGARKSADVPPARRPEGGRRAERRARTARPAGPATPSPRRSTSRVVRLADPRPWWLDRPRVIQRGRKGRRDGR